MVLIKTVSKIENFKTIHVWERGSDSREKTCSEVKLYANNYPHFLSAKKRHRSHIFFKLKLIRNL